MSAKRLRIGAAGLGVALLACLAVSVGVTRAQQQPQQQDASSGGAAPRRVKVLWLGDDGHHTPLARARQVYADFARRGIDFTYTDRMEDITPENLARYDALMVYANVERIAPAQEQAILDYVAAGHGYVPVHCGSFCFLNSSKLTALTGARFQRHGTGTFTETIAQADHPIEKGLNPITSWDETYVHNMHNDVNREVLGYRVEGDHREPYTWTRTEGKGRVFYTAWGHDERTWGNKDFQNLLERGLRWAAGDWALQPQPKFKPFEYTEANLPNYIQGARWGVTGEPIKVMQQPVSPEESMKHMVVPPGMALSLVAAEPEVKKPIALAFDERGRLWIAETFDYPNDLQPRGEGHDQIKICEDTDGDGKADKFTVFADKLSIPTSLCFANGGVLVAQTPDMLFLKDTDGDGVADERKVLFTGWGTSDTHATVSNLRYGFDGWVYGTVGYSGFRGTVGGQDLRFGQGLFRMKPDGSKLEFLGSSNNNTWGLGLSEDNQVFASTANNNPSFYLSIPIRYYDQVSGIRAGVLAPMADTPKFYPLTEKVRQVDQFGAYTAGAGHALYTARSFPQYYWNRIAFVSEPTGHIVGQFVMKPDGSGFKSRNDFNLLASDDEWTSPIVADVGPDGAVWVIDWYNYVIQHNPIPPGFKAGKGGAYVTPLRDKRHGRIYRLTYKAAQPSKTFDLSKASADQLVEAMKSDNMLWRMHAQRLLAERNEKGAIPKLIELVNDKKVDEIGLNAPAVHALWAIHNLGGFEGEGADKTIAAATAALSHPSAAVRKAAVDVLPRTEKSLDAVLTAKVLEDKDPQVRKSALLALTEMPAADAAGQAVFNVLSEKATQGNRGLTDAATIAAVRHDAGFLKAAFSAFGNKAGADAGKAAGEALPAAAAAKSSAPANLIPNPSFEDGQNGNPAAWRVRDYAGQAQHAWVESGARTGRHALQISSQSGSDASYFVDVPVEPDTDYRLSAWVKTENLTGAMGALLNVHGTEFRTNAVNGTSGDWKRVEVTFNSGPARRVSINCLFGGWGRAKGTAWYDDVELVRAASPGLPGAVGRAVSIVTQNYARRGPADSVVATLASLKGADPQLAAAVIDGLATGWPNSSELTPKLSEADAQQLQGLMNSLPADARGRLIALAEKWNRRDLFTMQVAALTAEMKQALAAAKSTPAQRVTAAHDLVAMDDTAETVDAVLKQVTPTAPPEVQSGLIEALGSSKNTGVGRTLIGKWGSFGPSAQRATVDLLLRKPAWTTALLDGIESGAVNGKDLRPEQWQVLKATPDPRLASRAKTLEQAKGRQPSADKQKVIAALEPLAQKQGDPVLGKAVFEKNCMVCHTIEGTGGKVGPELTGIGARPKGDLLVEIIDPNRSVEGTYRQWIVQAGDQVITGRLLSESGTSVEIIDATAKTHVIDRNDIRRIRASDLSVMPEGFEQLPPQDLQNLLEFLSTSKVKR